MDWMDRDNPFIDEDGCYDDEWLKPCTDVWRNIHPFGFNQYDYDNPWGNSENQCQD